MNSAPAARLHWYFNVVLVFAYNGFLALRALPVLADPAETLANKFFLVLALVSYAYGMAGHFETVVVRCQLTPFVHSYINSLDDWKSKRLSTCG